MTYPRNYTRSSSRVLAIFVVLCALSLSIILLKTPHAFAQVRDDRNDELRLDARTSASERAIAQSVALPASTGSSTTESIQAVPNIIMGTSTPHSDFVQTNDAETSDERQPLMSLVSSSSSFTLDDLGSQIKYCIVFPFLNSFGPPIPTFHVPGCPNAATTPGDSDTSSTSITTGTLSGTVVASPSSTPTTIATGTLSGTVVSSADATLSGTVVATSVGNGGGSSGGGGSGGGGSSGSGGRSGSSASNGSSPSGVGGGNPAGEVLGASTSIPGVPNTGAGGEAARTMFSLLLSGLMALSGAWYLIKSRKLSAL